MPKYVSITLADGGSSYLHPVSEPLNLALLFGDNGEDAPVGEEYVMTLIEMTKEEIEALPEFDGF